jgi:hypothetical protein
LTSLNLAGNALYGIMPDLRGLDQLIELNLIPNGNLTGITVLTLQSTELPSPTLQVKEIAKSDSDSNATLSPAIISAIAIAISIFAVLVGAFVVYKCYFKAKLAARKRRRRNEESCDMSSSYAGNQADEVEELEEDIITPMDSIPVEMAKLFGSKKLHITGQISKGGFGYVYKGIFQGKDVAVKRLIVPKDKRRKLKLADMFGMIFQH